MKPTKAIIAVAGYGTRRLPITKSLEKCMLPIGNRPVVDYLVQDCIANGVTDIIFVVGEQHEQIKEYYSEHNEQLEEHLEQTGKMTELAEVRRLTTGARFRYVIQDRHQRRGTAVTLALCAHLINDDEQVIFLAGDDFMYNPNGQSSVALLMQLIQHRQAEVALLGYEVDGQDVSRYGVIEHDGDQFVRIVEKPAVGQAPSNLINISKYVFTKRIFDHAVDLVRTTKPVGEYLLTDALNRYVEEGKKVMVAKATGEYLDGGTLEGWLHANNQILAHERKALTEGRDDD